jgi:hypothetical protein
MNDHEALTAITAALDSYFRGELGQILTLAAIASIAAEASEARATA